MAFSQVIHIQLQKHIRNNLEKRKQLLGNVFFWNLVVWISHWAISIIVIIPVSFMLVCQIMQLPAKHFLPLTHSLKQLAAIISRSDQRQRQGRVTPSVHNQRTICFEGQGGGSQEEESLRDSPALNVILTKINSHIEDIFFFLNWLRDLSW